MYKAPPHCATAMTTRHWELPRLCGHSTLTLGLTNLTARHASWHLVAKRLQMGFITRQLIKSYSCQLNRLVGDSSSSGKENKQGLGKGKSPWAPSPNSRTRANLPINACTFRANGPFAKRVWRMHVLPSHPAEKACVCFKGNRGRQNSRRHLRRPLLKLAVPVWEGTRLFLLSKFAPLLLVIVRKRFICIDVAPTIRPWIMLGKPGFDSFYVWMTTQTRQLVAWCTEIHWEDGSLWR